MSIFTGAAIRFIAAEQSTTFELNDVDAPLRGVDRNDATCTLTDDDQGKHYWQGEFNVTSTLDYVIIRPYTFNGW